MLEISIGTPGGSAARTPTGPMSTLAAVAVPDLGQLEVAIRGEACIKLTGTIAVRDPQTTIRPYFRQLHDAACALPGHHLEVDVVDLTFVNSSAIRTFLDWTSWIQEEPEERRYALTFKTSPGVAWQRASLPALAALAPEIIRIDVAR